MKRFQVRNIVDASSQRDIRDAYCVSCAVHGRIVRARKAEDRRIREFVRPQFKGVGFHY